MSQLKIWSVTLPTAAALIILFQNCSNNGFQPLASSMESNFGSAVPQPLPDGTTLPPETPDTGRRILTVCASGCMYQLPSQAAAASADNDIIDIKAGNYDDCFNLTKNNIKLRGVNGRAHFTGKICSGKGIINISGANTVVENLEFSGMANPDTNGAGLRHQGLGLTVRNTYFHDGEEGILSEGRVPSSNEDIVLVENSKFERIGGGGGYAHGVYFGGHRQVIFKNSQIFSGRDQGHEFKCRAENVTISCSQIASLDGFDSYTLNFPDGGNVNVVNSVVEQGSATSNGVFIDYGSEMGSPFRWASNQLNFSNVTFLNDRNSGSYFQVVNTNQFAVSNSILVGGGTLSVRQAPVLANTQQVSNRSAAGLPAYPALPVPAGCGTIGLLF